MRRRAAHPPRLQPARLQHLGSKARLFLVQPVSDGVQVPAGLLVFVAGKVAGFRALESALQGAKLPPRLLHRAAQPPQGPPSLSFGTRHDSESTGFAGREHDRPKAARIIAEACPSSRRPHDGSLHERQKFVGQSMQAQRVGQGTGPLGQFLVRTLAPAGQASVLQRNAQPADGP